ncbi:MAG: Amidohydrolase [Syntrophaceae bacterium PtaU1.Bin231]|nr:MAG: Amidohydrolase [Syntrophaceae bacterium PtaU1.Bin231]
MNNPSLYAAGFLRTGVSPLPIIDVHAHMGQVYGTSLSMATAGEMIAVMDRENIEAVFCSPHSALFDPGAGNAELESAMAQYPGRFRGYCAFNPNYPSDMPGDAKEWIAKGYIGFKFLPEYHRRPIGCPEYERALRFADAHALVLLVHTWGDSPYNSPRQLARIPEDYPNVTLILGHSAPGELDAAIALAAQYPRVYLDLCDIHRHSGIVDRMVAGAGAQKVLFGTDIPWYDPAYCLGSVLFSRISDEEKALILYGNAKRIADRYRSMELEG